jgi:uncharacterized paraquat-inducible protein A
MPDRQSDEDDADDLDDRDDPIESDMDDHDEPELVQCPHCRKYLNEEADRCHHCGQDVMEARSLPVWAMVTAAVLLALGGISIYYFGVLL